LAGGGVYKLQGLLPNPFLGTGTSDLSVRITRKIKVRYKI